MSKVQNKEKGQSVGNAFMGAADVLGLNPFEFRASLKRPKPPRLCERSRVLIPLNSGQA